VPDGARPGLPARAPPSDPRGPGASQRTLRQIMQSAGAPSQTPKPIVECINREVVQIMSQQTVRQRVLDVTMSEVATSSRAEFGEFIRKEVARWREVIQKTGIRED
jgi:tripartite-type tricarboxylate transporter receptor subunit TctC